MAGTSYLVLKRVPMDPDVVDDDGAPIVSWEEIAYAVGNPDTIVRELVKTHGAGVYWPVPTRTRAINAEVVTPEPIVKLSDFGEETASNETASSGGGIALERVEGTLDVGLAEPVPAPV